MSTTETLHIQRFEKRPTQIDAIQVTIDNVAAVAAWCKGVPLASPLADSTNPDSFVMVDQHINIHTLEGTMRAGVGDWIVKGIAGEFYPVRADIFEATYRYVTDVNDPHTPPLFETD